LILSKNDDLRFLEQFLGSICLTVTPGEPSSISEAVSHFLRNSFLEILVEESNLYHAQNAGKYKTSSKSLHGKKYNSHQSS
jgi:hypothetical protein